MMSGICLQVWPLESIPKNVKQPFETEVTYIIVGPTHGLKSILMWDYQLQVIVIPYSLINTLLQKPFSQTQLPPLPQILL